jgi:histidinol-phosphate aminotransferase
MELYKKLIKPEIQNLVRIKDASDERFEYLRLEKNERLYPFNKNLLELFRKSIQSEHLSGYPELGRTYQKLARHVGVNPEQLLLAAGSDLAIKSIYEACIERDDSIVLPSPCYAMYEVYANMFGAKIKSVAINREWSFNVDEMLSQVDDRTKMLVLENPNASVGKSPKEGEIEKCAGFLLKRNVILLIDEAYFFVESQHSHACEIIERYPNVIISQSFSKAPGLAGLRVGYLIGEAELIKYISRVRPMHEITSLSALAVEWVLEHPQLVKEYREGLQKSKAYLKSKFAELGIEYRDTHANFVLGYLPDKGRCRNIAGRLKKYGILAKRPFEENSLKGWIRFTVGTQSDSKRLICAIRACFNES